MADDSTGMPERSFGCTYGCGNPFDVVLVMVQDGTTEFLCVPCFVQAAMTAVQAMTEAENPVIQEAVSVYLAAVGEQAPGPRPKPGRRNAPVTSDMPEGFGDFDESVPLDGI